jgi:carbon monoxide dehydrogenase subunit G
MQMQGERLIAAERMTVWSALNDPGVLQASIAGCESLEKTSPTSFEAVVTQKVGPVKARFHGTVALSEIVEAKSYTITGEGKGGAAGFAKGGAKVRLEDAALEDGSAGTRLHYEAEAKVGGKLAQLGARLIDGFAKKMADDFFTRFQEAVEGPGDSGESEAAAPEAGAAAGDASGASAAKKGWFKRLTGKG